MSSESFLFFWSGPFSQWHPSPFTLGGVTYNCAEQYMMAGKARLFGDSVREQLIMANAAPDVQQSLGREVAGFDPDVWAAHARSIVYRGSMAKYQQNADLREHLLATGTRILVEASATDRVWGIGLRATDPRAKHRNTWRGTNWLGEILTQVRDELAAGI